MAHSIIDAVSSGECRLRASSASLAHWRAGRTTLRGSGVDLRDFAGKGPHRPSYACRPHPKTSSSGATRLTGELLGTVQAANVYLSKLPRLLSIAPVERKRREPSRQCGLNKQTEQNKKKEKRLSNRHSPSSPSFSFSAPNFASANTSR